MFIPAIRLVLSYVLDTWILPGTTAGSEILWLYVIAWKRNFTAISTAETFLLFIQRYVGVKSDADFSGNR